MEPLNSAIPTPKRVIAVLAVLVVLVATLAVTAAYFYSKFESEASVNSQDSQLENGIPTTAAASCLSADALNDNPLPQSFVPLLPKSLGNVTDLSIGLQAFWPVPINSSTYQVYEVWSVGYYMVGNLANRHFIDMLYSVNCTLS